MAPRQPKLKQPHGIDKERRPSTRKSARLQALQERTMLENANTKLQPSQDIGRERRPSTRKSARLQGYQKRTMSENTNTKPKHLLPSPTRNSTVKEVSQAEVQGHKRKGKRWQDEEIHLCSTTPPSQKQPQAFPLQSPIKDSSSKNAVFVNSEEHQPESVSSSSFADFNEQEVKVFQYPLVLVQQLRKKFVQTIQHPKPQKPLLLKRLHASSLEAIASDRYRPESIKPFVTQWVESTPESESCISRRRTKSASDIDSARDTPIPSLSYSFGYDQRFDGGSADGYYSASLMSTVNDSAYREAVLAPNNIHLRQSWEDFPEDIARLVELVGKDRDSPGLSLDDVKQNKRLFTLERFVGEPAIENYFKAYMFPDPEPSDSLNRIDRTQIARHAVPNVNPLVQLSIPVPDMLYGYKDEAFLQQQPQLWSMRKQIVANNYGLFFPFFVIEFKFGSLFAATNQCLGGAASCVNINERLNRQLRECKSDKVSSIDSAVFSIAMTGSEARLYISWKHDELSYYTQKIDSFLLQKPRDYVEFRRHVLNIIDWGKDERLKGIQKSLDTLLEENRKIASQRAKSRPPPSPNAFPSRRNKKVVRDFKGDADGNITGAPDKGQSS